jgi:hypothetical protein
MNKESTLQNYQAFSRIIEMMSLMERAHELSPAEAGETANAMCDLTDDSKHELSMEEVLFWAGVSTGMEVCRNFEEGSIDAQTAEKIMNYSSVFAYSTQNAVVDLTLQSLETGKQ